MAHMTVEQADVVRQLEADYGEPDIMKIEYTPQAYGLVWMSWSTSVKVRGLVLSRNLFIKPDGSRLAWQQIQMADDCDLPEGGQAGLPHGEHPYDYGYPDGYAEADDEDGEQHV